MATLSSFYISGTYGGLTFYVVNGRQLVRSKTSISKKRFFTDPAFAKQRQYSNWLKMASPVASCIYQQLKPQKGLQQRMTGLLITWMKQGATLAEAAQRLAQLLFPNKNNTTTATTIPPHAFASIQKLYGSISKKLATTSVAGYNTIPLRI